MREGTGEDREGGEHECCHHQKSAKSFSKRAFYLSHDDSLRELVLSVAL
ncbi:MAG: hypothetical protein DFNUSKGM_002323 [Candidatus Fervidibacter sacchari]